MGRQNKDKHNITRLLQEALHLHQQGDIPGAETLYHKILKAEPNQADVLHLLGVIAYERGFAEIAIKHIRKAIAINPAMPIYHNNLGNALLSTDRSEEAVQCFQKAVLLNPSFAEAYFNCGKAFVKLEMLDKASDQYRRAIKLKPDLYSARYNLANVLKKQGNLEEAVKGYHDTIALQPDFAEAYNNLGDAYRMQQKFDLATENCRKAIGLSPDNDSFYCNLGTVFFDMKEFEEALGHYKIALRLNNECANAHCSTGLILLLQGRLEEGWGEYEWRFRVQDVAAISEINIPQWNGEAIGGKALLVRGEQGVGDNIQFIRYIPLLKELGCTVIYECRKDLMRLFQGCCSIDYLVEEHTEFECGITPDYYVFLMSLPLIIGTTLNTIPAHIPCLTVADKLVDKWGNSINQLLTPGCRPLLRVGIVWAGNPDHKNDYNRSCSLSDFASLASLSGVELFSLQKGYGAEQMYSPPLGLKITGLGEKFEDFYDTAAAIMNLDLIISVDTSVVHLAGALGKPVWTLLPYVSDWRWMLDRDDSPWYPTMRLFRQPGHGDWKSVINDVMIELKKLITVKEERWRVKTENMA